MTAILTKQYSVTGIEIQWMGGVGGVGGGMCLPINGLTVRPQGGLLRPVDREGLSLGSQGFHLHA